MNDKLTGLMADLFRALAHPTRVRIIDLLQREEKCVCELLELLQLEQSNVSQHLAVLRQAGIVNSRRDGGRMLYSLANPHLEGVLASATQAIRHSLTEVARLIEEE